MKRLPKNATGRYVEAIIQVLEKDGKVDELTLYHEAFHAYMDLFAEKMEKQKVLDVIKDKFPGKVKSVKKLYAESGKKLSENNAAEEVLADKFAEYLKDKNNVTDSTLRKFFDKLIKQIKEWTGKIEEVDKFFEGIVEKKRPAKKPIPGEEKLKIKEDQLTIKAREYKKYKDFEKDVMNNSNMGLSPRIQEIDIRKIIGTDEIELEEALKSGKKMSVDKIEDIIAPTDDFKEGQEVVYPIEVIKNNDGTFNLQAGNHRLAQKLINGEFTIQANILGDRSGKSLRDIWEEANEEKFKLPAKPREVTKDEIKKRIVPEALSEEARRAEDKEGKLKTETAKKLDSHMRQLLREENKLYAKEQSFILPDQKFQQDIDGELESQYQGFKDIMKLKTANNISEMEDSEQFKKQLKGRSIVTVKTRKKRDKKIRKSKTGKPMFSKKTGKMLIGNVIRDKDGKPVVIKTKSVRRVGAMELDNLLYSQKETNDEIFEIFKNRILEERSNKGWKGEIKAERAELKKKFARVERSIAEEERRGETFAKGQLAGFGRGYAEGETKAYSQINKRRYKIRIIRDYFNLTDKDIKGLAKRDLRYMTDLEFDQFMDDIAERAMELNTTHELKNSLVDHINKYELKKVDNMRLALQLPPIEKMNIKQLEKFHDAILPFEFADEFLSVRKLETLDNTELAGMRTVREIKDNLIDKFKKDGAKISDKTIAKVDFGDRFKYDTALANKSPFYNLMVQETLKSQLQAEQVYLNIEEQTEALVKKARDSRKKLKGEPLKVRIGNVLVPQDKLVFKWLESNEAKKEKLQANMTNEEIDLAVYIQTQYAKMRDILVENQTLEKFRENYITHTQRSFWEAVKDDSFLTAIKEQVTQNRRQQAYFDIIDDTGNILPLEKFFSFSLRRIPEETKKQLRADGLDVGIDPTKNVAKAFLTYFRAFSNKAHLDNVIPMLDSYVFVLQDREKKTPRGLELDTALKNFFNDWMNTKKGRAKKLYVLDQGTKLDTALRAGNALVTIIDLGLNIPVGLASNVGETAMNYIQLGNRKMARGVKRKFSKKGKAMLKKYENFTGKGALAEMNEVSKDIGDKLLEGTFFLFKVANVRASQTFFLGSITDQEWESGEVSPERLAQMKIDMGRYRAVQGSESIIGKTSLGKTFTKYKTWAIPSLTSMTGNVKKMVKMLKDEKGLKRIINPIKTKEFQELFRATIPMLVLYSLFSAKDDDDSYTNQLITKIRREILSSISALSPKMWLGIPRMQTFLEDIGTGIDQLLKLEEYKTIEGKKGIQTLKRTVTPQVIKQAQKAGIIPKRKPVKKKKEALPDLPDLPELPELPDLPDLPELPEL